MQTDMDHLEHQASARGVPLLDAFVRATGGSSTYYRARRGASLRLDVAQRVERAIEDLASDGEQSNTTQ